MGSFCECVGHHNKSLSHLCWRVAQGDDPESPIHSCLCGPLKEGPELLEGGLSGKEHPGVPVGQCWVTNLLEYIGQEKGI